MIQHANNTQLDADLQSLANDVDILYQFICAVTVLGMQAGFSLVEAGKIRSCLRSVLTKNIVDVSLCTVCWWALGHGFSKGPISNSFIAVGHPFMLPSNLVRWLWDVSFVSMCVTITSGAMAERTNFVAYLVCVLVHSSFTYPVGFLAMENPAALLPTIDFCGAGTVHMLGGFAGLVGAIVVGPRPGAFLGHSLPPPSSKTDQFVQERIKSTQLLWLVLGVSWLWVGFYGFNCGSVQKIVGKTNVIATIAVNTTLSAVVAALTAGVVAYIHRRCFEPETMSMGTLSGLVSITASAPVVAPHTAAAIGCVGCLIWYISGLLVVRLRIDDPVDAFPLHGCCGLWALLAASFCTNLEVYPNGRLYFQGQGVQLLYQISAGAIIIVWTVCISLVAMLGTKVVLRHRMRVSNEAEYNAMVYEAPRFGPKGKVSLLFTDIQSSTTLWETDEECMAECLMAHDAVLRCALNKHRGFEVKTEGDAFMIVFSEAVDAARYCISVQHALQQVKWPKKLYDCWAGRIETDGTGCLSAKGLRVRMGFHVGSPKGKENPVTGRSDYFGKDVNYAARVSACGAGGQIILSAVAMEALLPFYCDPVKPLKDEEPPFDMIPESLYEVGPLRCWIEFLGRYKLKGITGAGQVGECLFQIIPFGLENRQFPPLANHIPLPLTSLHFVDTGRPQHTLMPPGSCVSSDSFDGPPAGARGRSLSGASEHTQVLEDCVERRLSQTLIGSPEAV